MIGWLNVFFGICLLAVNLVEADYEINIKCISNCMSTGLVNPSKPVILTAECKEACLGVTYVWKLQPDVSNKKKELLANETIGEKAITLIIRKDVLLPKERYYITVTTTKTGSPPRTRTIMLQMAKCSKKYPCVEEDADIPSDYLDTAPETTSWKPKTLTEIESEVNALSSVDSNQIISKKSSVLTDIKHLPLNDSQDAQKSAKIVENIVTTDSANLTPNLVKLASEANENIVDSKLNFLKNSGNPSALASEVETLANTVLNTVPHIINENITQLVSHRKEEENVTTVAYAEEFPFTENYPVYNDFDIVYLGKKKNLEDASMATVNMINKLGKASALTMASTESEKKIVTSNTCILSIVKSTEDLKDKLFDLCNITLYVSEALAQELGRYGNQQHITFSVLTKNPFWWHKLEITSNVASIEFESGGAVMTRVYNPVRIQFTVYKNQPQVVKGTCKIPMNNINFVADDAITVHKFFVMENIATLMIRFENMQANDEIQVVITSDRRPQSKDFKHAYRIPLRNSIVDNYTIIKYISIRAYKTGYIGIYPTKTTLLHGSFENNTYIYNYSLKLASVSCNRWSDNYNWLSGDCKISETSTLSTVHCFCTHLSSFGVSLKNIKSEQDLGLYTPIKLSRKYCYTILITAIIVFLLYILTLVFAWYKDHNLTKLKKVFFLFDNNLTHKYSYVIAVYTSNQRFSGTTANIGFKIHGSEGESDNHALFGFEKPILQTGSDDWFLLLTRTSLGDLKILDLWTDCYGSRSSWYCKKVIVYNLENNLKWVFNVDCLFSVLDNTTFCTTEAQFSISKDKQTKWRIASEALRDNHLWFSFFERSKQPAFTFVERVTVIWNVHVIIMFFTYFFYGGPCFQLYAFLDVGYYIVGWREYIIAIASAFISFIINSAFVYIFMNAQPIKWTNLTRHFTYKFKRNWRYIAWCAMVASNILGNLFLVMCGLWIGFISSLLWLTTFLLALLFYIFVLESIRVIAMAFLQSDITVTYIEKELDMSEIESEKMFLLKRYGENGMRPLFSKLYEQLPEQSIEVIREKELYRIDLRNLVIDIIMFMSYMVILCCVVLIQKDNMSYYCTRNLKSIFVDDAYIGRMSFHEIDSVKRFYRYMRVTFLPALHTSNWYANYSCNETGLIANFNTKLIGIPRMRQVRIQNNSCPVSSSMKFVVKQCHAEYSASIQETQHFSPYWKPKTNRKLRSLSDTVWLYTTGYESQSSVVFGQLTMYPSSGYLAYLGRTRQNAEMVLQYLENTNWIDEKTRAVFIETVFYNANRNLFTILTLIVEKSATGKYITRYSIETAKFLILYNELEISSYLTFLIFVMMILLFTWKKLKQMSEETSLKSFVSNWWSLIDLSIVFFAFGFICMSFVRSQAVGSLLKVLENAAHNEFVSFNSALFWDDFVHLIATLLVAISTVRVWKLLRFARMFRVFELTLTLALKYLVAMVLVTLLVIFAFSISGFIIFGPYSSDFRSVSHTLLSLILLGFGYNSDFNYDALDEAYGSIGYLYYACYMILLLIIVNLFVTIIVVAYESAKNYFDENDSEKLLSFGLRNFLRDEFDHYYSGTKGRQTWRHVAESERLHESAIKNEISQSADATREIIAVKNSRLKVMLKVACSLLTVFISKNSTERALHTNEEAYKLLILLLQQALINESPDDDEEMIYFKIPDENTFKYCVKTRLDDMVHIVNYLLRRRAKKQNIHQHKKIDISTLAAMNYLTLNMSKRLDEITPVTFQDQSTSVTYDDLGLEVVSSDSSNTLSDTRNNYI